MRVELLVYSLSELPETAALRSHFQWPECSLEQTRQWSPTPPRHCQRPYRKAAVSLTQHHTYLHGGCAYLNCLPGWYSVLYAVFIVSHGHHIHTARLHRGMIKERFSFTHDGIIVKWCEGLQYSTRKAHTAEVTGKDAGYWAIDETLPTQIHAIQIPNNGNTLMWQKLSPLHFSDKNLPNPRWTILQHKHIIHSLVASLPSSLSAYRPHPRLWWTHPQRLHRSPRQQGLPGSTRGYVAQWIRARTATHELAITARQDLWQWLPTHEQVVPIRVAQSHYKSVILPPVVRHWQRPETWLKLVYQL